MEKSRCLLWFNFKIKGAAIENCWNHVAQAVNNLPAMCLT